MSRYTSASRSGTASTTDSNRSARLYSTAPPDPAHDRLPVIRAKGGTTVKGPRTTNLTVCQKTLEEVGPLLQPVLVLPVCRQRDARRRDARRRDARRGDGP